MSVLAPLGVRDIASECRRRARLDTTDNMAAIVFLLAAKTIERMADRLELQSLSFERLESRIATLEDSP